MRDHLARFCLLPAIVIGIVLVGISLGAISATTTAPSADSRRSTRDPAGLVAHEWGTFTSIAGEAGQAVEWLPAQAPSELPCFVRRIRVGAKGLLAGTVRMETPVIYFYSPTDVTVNAKVRFKEGAISEWYPQAAVTPAAIEPDKFARPGFEATIEWSDIKVTPRVAENFPADSSSDHYYAARRTDAAPLQVGRDQEKFLFYRGVGRFTPPLTAIVRNDEAIDVRNDTGEPLGTVVLFENRGGTVRYQIRQATGASIRVTGQSPRGELTALYDALERMLVSAGLYPKEAAAMVATWRDSWFEEGTRLLYVVPRANIDTVLPLDIRPRPVETTRVFVGRMELMTTRTLDDVKGAILRNDRPALYKYGRFFTPIVNRIRAQAAFDELGVIQQQLPSIYGSWPWTRMACPQSP
jgi:hypothetical protein